MASLFDHESLKMAFISMPNVGCKVYLAVSMLTWYSMMYIYAYLKKICKYPLVAVGHRLVVGNDHGWEHDTIELILDLLTVSL